MALKVVCKPDDEPMAVRIKDLLEQEGIPTMIRSYQMPWYDGLARVMRPEWGEVLVEDTDFDRARDVVKDLLYSLEQTEVPEPEDELDPDNEDLGHLEPDE
jgi:hypothetical protein